jgi:large conductance mechanosensitive channel
VVWIIFAPQRSISYLLTGRENAMGFVKEFKDFAMRGNVIDLAVGVVIGGAFGKIVSSLVENIFMTPLNLITAKSGVNFNALSLKYSDISGGSRVELPVMTKEGKPELLADGTKKMILSDPDILKYGPFLQQMFEFLIIAFALFMVVKAINTVKSRLEKPAEAPPTPEDIVLLREIRDSLSKSSK